MKTWAAVLPLFLLLSCVGLDAQAQPVSAPPFPPRGKFIFSDLCVGAQPWDLQGHRVEFVHDPEFDDVIIEFFDKGFDSDILHAEQVSFDPKTGRLWFSYEDYSDEYSFDGYISSKLLIGSFDDDLQVHTLPRVPNSWPEEPPCRKPDQDTTTSNPAG